MAAALKGVLQGSLAENVQNSKILVVGAGGIGCEVLKNLVLTGFKTIEVVMCGERGRSREPLKGRGLGGACP